jgi:hypothetical protein
MPGQYSTRSAFRPRLCDEAKEANATARFFLCARCRAQVLICSCCDRGNIYCAQDCAQVARRGAQRAAGRRYQLSLRGRRNHAARAQRWCDPRDRVGIGGCGLAQGGAHQNGTRPLLARIGNWRGIGDGSSVPRHEMELVWSGGNICGFSAGSDIRCHQWFDPACHLAVAFGNPQLTTAIALLRRQLIFRQQIFGTKPNYDMQLLR